jgi:type II secretory pathway pseudopilin PulG
MSRRNLIRRTRARLDRECGFTILETVIAMTVIFASLTALMYTATSGFRYIALARERQAATGVATRLMEQIRALSVDTITDGMKTSDITSDPKIKTPSDCADGAYHYLTCAGEKIVHESDPATAQPLVPHTGTLSAPEYPTTYTWATYITNSDPTNDPYRLTVIVSWSGGAVSGAAKFVQLQSLWSSPKGCAASPVIHPFAGACQPFFTGTATAPQGSIGLSGTVNGIAVSGASLFGPSAEARGSIEQVSQMQGAVGQSGASWSTTTRGLASLATAADGNPSTGTPTYDPASGSPPAALIPSYGSMSVTGSPVAMSLSAGSSGDSGSSVAADAANSSTAKCPSVSAVWPSSQNDVLPCAWASAVRGATVSGTVDTTKLLGTTTSSAGLLTLAQLTGTSTTIDSWADRQVSAGTTGTLGMTVKRILGTTELIGIPAKFLAASVSGNDTLTAASITTLGALQACMGASNNYVIRSTAGTATATATTGVSASNPSAAWSGANVKVYTGSACVTYTDVTGLNASSAQQPSFTGFTLQRYIRPGGSNHNCMTYKVLPVASAPLLFGGVSTTKSPSSGTTLTDANATVNALVNGQVQVQLIYETNQNSTCTSASAVKETLLDLTTTINVGSLTARSQYTPAPTGGE